MEKRTEKRMKNLPHLNAQIAKLKTYTDKQKGSMSKSQGNCNLLQDPNMQ